MMFRHTALLALLGLGACVVDPRPGIVSQEDSLAAAGFTELPANTPQRAAMLGNLPPNQMAQRIDGSHVSYVYADPTVCHCLYAGSQDAFGRYQQQRQFQRLASDNLRAAELNSDLSWDWGPWGYGGGFYR